MTMVTLDNDGMRVTMKLDFIPSGWRRGLVFAMAFVAMLDVAIGSTPAVAQDASAKDLSAKATQQMFDAVQSNDLPAVQSSIAAGADVTAHNAWGLTAAELAVDMGYFRIAHYLISVRNLRDRHETQTDRETPSAGSAQTSEKSGKESAGTTSAQSTKTAAGATATSTKASTPAAPQAPVLAQVAPWPANVPNPFDPHTPVFGSRLPLSETR